MTARLKFIFQSVFIICLLLPAQVLAQDSIAFTVRGNIQDGENIKQTTETLVFAADRFAVIGTAETSIYDFAAGHIRQVDHEARTVVKYEPYAVAAFREMEIANRYKLFVLLPEKMEDAGAMPKLRPVDLEMTFGIAAPQGPHPEPIAKSQNGAKAFLYDATPVAGYELSDTSLPAEMAALFGKYILYAHQWHPAIRRTFMEEGRYPAKKFYNVQRAPRPELAATYNFEPVPVPDNAFDVPSDYTVLPTRDARLNKIFDASLTSPRSTPSDYEADMRALIDAGNYTGAVMRFFEYSVAFGGNADMSVMGPLLKQALAEVPVAENMPGLMQAITSQPQSEAQLKSAIAHLAEARSRNYTHGYVLNIFEANYQAMQNKSGLAANMIMAALEENPHLLGAYKDLGDKFIQGYNTFTAWACWNHAAALDKDFPLLAPVKEYEKALRSRHPEFF